MFSPRHLVGFIALAFALLTATDAAAQGLLSVAELTDSATLVLSGHVASVSSQWDPAVNGIYTYAVVDVREVWKGSVPSSRIVVKTLGGRVGDIELRIDGQARLEAGRDVALWLAVRPRDRTLYPSVLAQSVRDVSDASAATALKAEVQSRAPGGAADSFKSVPPEWQPMAVNAFTFGPPDGGPARWHEAESATRVFVDYQPPSGLGGGVTEIDNAIVAWDNSGMTLQLQIGGARSARCLATYENGGDGRISVSFNDPCGELAGLGITFGVGGGYFTSGELRTVSGVEFKKFLQGVVVLGTAPQLSQRGCFQDAVTHNLGHTIGLGDSNVSGAMMAADYAAACSATPRTLAQDDRDGARAIYPSGLSNAIPGAPTNLTGTATGTTVSLNWSAPALGGAVATYVIEAGNASGNPSLSIATNSVATSASFTNVPAGFYYIRVRARNSIGTGLPSNELGLAVACPAPQPPTSLLASAAANNVTFSWTPPASAPLAYVLAVGSTPGASNLLRYQFAPTTSLSATGAPGTYYVRLHARGACGESTASNEVVVTLPAPCVTPSAPANFTHAVGANRVVSLNWSASIGTPPVTYTIEVGSSPGLSNLLVSNLGTGVGLSVQAPPGTYFVRIRAVNACGTPGPASVERTIVVP